MSFLEDLDAAADDIVAEYAAGGYEPDGIGLAFGAPPTGDVGWGSDLSCTDDCDEDMSEVDGDSPRAVGESLARRLMTPHGRIINNSELLTAVDEDPDYGYDLMRLLHVPLDSIEARAHVDLATAECMKDDRVASCAISYGIRGNTVDVVVSGSLKSGQTYEKTFTLTSDNVARALA